MMAPEFTAPPDLRERLTHVMLFVLGSSSLPTLDDWYRAVDDQFDDLDESGKRRLVEAALLIMRGERPGRRSDALLAA